MDGGLLTLLLFLAVLVKCFSSLGLARKALQSQATEEDSAKEWFVWCLGCALFVHVVTIMTVEYYDQMRVVWYVLLAMIASMTSEILANKPEERSSLEMDNGAPPDSSPSAESPPSHPPIPETAPGAWSAHPFSL